MFSGEPVAMKGEKVPDPFSSDPFSSLTPLSS